MSTKITKNDFDKSAQHLMLNVRIGRYLGLATIELWENSQEMASAKDIRLLTLNVQIWNSSIYSL